MLYYEFLIRISFFTTVLGAISQQIPLDLELNRQILCFKRSY